MTWKEEEQRRESIRKSAEHRRKERLKNITLEIMSQWGWDLDSAQGEAVNQERSNAQEARGLFDDMVEEYLRTNSIDEKKLQRYCVIRNRSRLSVIGMVRVDAEDHMFLLADQYRDSIAVDAERIED